MKTLGKLIAGALVILVLLCVLGVLALTYTEKGKSITRFGTDIFKITRTAKGVEGLASKFPYTPPEDGNVPEERLLVYIAVCRQVKPAAKAYGDWVQAHEGEKGDFKDAEEVIRLTQAVMEGASKALEQNQMGPAEFGWIDRAMNKAGKEQGSKGTDLEREMLDSYAKVLGFPGLSPQERTDVAKEIAGFQERMGGAGRLSANAELYRKHAAELADCDPGDYGRDLLQGFTQGGHSRHRKVEAERNTRKG